VSRSRFGGSAEKIQNNYQQNLRQNQIEQAELFAQFDAMACNLLGDFRGRVVVGRHVRN
jgi:hypothetical protein